MTGVVNKFFETLSDGQTVVEDLLVEHGIAMFLGFQFLNGAGLLFFVPDDIVTPSFTLMYSNNIFDVFLIATAAAIAILIGNFLLYSIFRFLGDRIISSERREARYWRFMEWAIKGNAKISLVVLRLIPLFGGLAAIPAGLVKVDVKTFLIYSFIGFLIYELALAVGIWLAIEHGMISEISNKLYTL